MTESACPRCDRDVDHITSCPEGCPLCVTPNRPDEPREPATAADRTEPFDPYNPSGLVAPDDPDRCTAVAGRCERASHDDDRHYTTYEEGVWRWRAEARAATPPALDVERLAETNGKDWY